MMSRSNQFLICKGTSGMGNRILAACTALLYGEISGRKVIIDWRDQSYSESGENAFPKFFDCPEAATLNQLPDSDSIFPKVWIDNLGVGLGQLQRELNLSTYKEMSFDPTRLDYSEDILVFCSYTHKIPALRSLFVGKYASFQSLDTPAILRSVLDSKLRLVKEIDQAIANFKAANFEGEMVGVHVRYTDIKIPLDKLIDKVRQVVRRKRQATVFLATDSKAVIAQFRAEFPRLVTTDKWFPPAGERLHQNWDHCPDRYQNGMEALTDIFLLSDCDSLIFSSKSSFGYVASLLSKADKRHIFDVEAETSFVKRAIRKSKALAQRLSVKG